MRSVSDDYQGAAIRFGSLRPAAEAPEKISACRQQEVVVNKLSFGLKRIEKPETILWPLGHTDSHGAIQLHDRRRADA